MSADLVKRWRRIARQYEQATSAGVLSERSTSERAIGEAQGFAEALRRCADSLEKSMARKRAKECK